jgi:hypothetical protein
MFASYGLSVLLSVPFLVLFEPTPLLYAAVLAGHVALSLTVFRYSRALFLALDYYLDPAVPPGPGDEGGGAPARARPRPAPGTRRREGRGRGSRLERTVA